MKASRIVWGILIIALAVVLILQGIGVLGSFTSMFGVIPIWKVLLGLVLLAVVISCMVKLRFEGVFLPLDTNCLLSTINSSSMFAIIKSATPPSLITPPSSPKIFAGLPDIFSAI